MSHSTPMPGDQAPPLAVHAMGGDPINIANEAAEKFTVILFYRGVHCPVCRQQLEELNGKINEFEQAGITVHAVSMDSEERAKRQKEEWDIANIRIGYGLTEDSARKWGLFISGKEKDSEPDRFCEPGMAILYPDKTIYALYLQTAPFARPGLDDLLKGLNFISENNYPIRGKEAA